MTKRRMGTRPVRTYWTPDGVALIEAYQRKHGIASFSAAAEMLVRLGLDKSPGEIVAPIIDSSIRQAVHRELDRLVRLQIATALNTEMAWRFGAVTLRDVGRMMTDEHRRGDSGRERYFRIKAYVAKEARRSLGRERLRALVEEFEPGLTLPNGATPPAAQPAEEQPSPSGTVRTLAEALGLEVDLLMANDEDTGA